MRNALQEYFYYTRMERNGLLVLGSLSLFCFLLPYFVLPFLPQQQINFSDFQSEVANFQPIFEKEKYASKHYSATNAANETPTSSVTMFYFDPNTATAETFVKLGLSEKVANNIVNYRDKLGTFSKVEDLKKIYTLKEMDYERLKSFAQIANLPTTALKFEKNKENSAPILQLFPFNPNTVSEAELAQLGLSDRIIQTILNFRSKGGTFRKPEDLSKVYGLSTAVFEQLKPYIQLETTKKAHVAAFIPPASQVPTAYVDATALRIDINTATVEEWQELKGIGPYFSKKIVGFRDKLGGFATIEQVGETHNFPDSVFQAIKPALKLSPVFKKIAINTEDEKTLAEHPYISNQLAKAIVNYRIQHGNFKQIEDFKKMRILKPKEAEQLLPYLAF